jgi:hypothetical protein
MCRGHPQNQADCFEHLDQILDVVDESHTKDAIKRFQGASYLCQGVEVDLHVRSTK